MNKIIGAIILVIAYILLIPGLTQPMLSVVGTVEKESLVQVGRQILDESPNVSGLVLNFADMMMDSINTEGQIQAFDKTQSILGTATELFETGHVPVAALIILFSVIIPVLKGLITVSTLAPLGAHWKNRLNRIASAISKWSMADVFVVAIFVAYLAANGLDGGADLVEFNAQLGPGFWFFVGFCLLSILATQLITWRSSDAVIEHTDSTSSELN